MAIAAVFRSWNIPRAVKYRTINRITGLKGTAVNVQSMVYGNLNDDSCTGVCFTRNAGNGIKELYGEFLINAQGEDVVAGVGYSRHACAAHPCLLAAHPHSPQCAPPTAPPLQESAPPSPL